MTIITTTVTSFFYCKFLWFRSSRFLVERMILLCFCLVLFFSFSWILFKQFHEYQLPLDPCCDCFQGTARGLSQLQHALDRLPRVVGAREEVQSFSCLCCWLQILRISPSLPFCDSSLHAGLRTVAPSKSLVRDSVISNCCHSGD